MKIIDKETIAKKLVINYQIAKILKFGNWFFEFYIEDKDMFDNLILGTWVNEKDENPRTLRAVSKKFHTQGNKPCPTDKEWRDAVMQIYDNFQWDKFGYLFLCPPGGCRNANTGKDCDEVEQAPMVSFSVLDGAHRSLATMLKFNNNILEFRPIPAILVTPRIVW